MRRRSFLALSALAIVALLILATVASATPNVPVQVAFIDVGQGDSTLIRSDDFAVLIDGGLPSAGPTVVAYLQQQEVPDLDVMLVTHADGDHVGGLEAAQTLVHVTHQDNNIRAHTGWLKLVEAEVQVT